AVDAPVAGACARDVDAVGRHELWPCLEVGGREPDLLSATRAVHHAPAYDVRASQQTRRGPDVAFGDFLAHDARVHDHSFGEHRTDDFDAEAVTPARFDQELDVALAATAEVEIVADHELLRVENVDQESLDAVVGLDLGERAREPLQHGRVHPAGPERLEPVVQRHQQSRRFVWAQHRDRMRLERQCDGGNRALRGVLAHLLQDDLVSAMDAVEVSYGDDGAFEQAPSPLEAADDAHGVTPT